ncbi:MAG: hypothetical protein HN348_09815 [Proteobacteria bacterium]|jgi:hypothetical protein|nr:hypothetical protein [Pseudomonadota bacterium]
MGKVIAMKMDASRLEEGLDVLGDLLQGRGLQYELVVIGGGALLLQGLVVRTTSDLDAVARVTQGIWESAKPLPSELTKAIREVGRALDLPHEPRDEKDWLNPGPSALRDLGLLPPGFESRLTKRNYGALTIRLAARQDLIYLKFWSATDIRRARSSVDIGDLATLGPTREELVNAVRWCWDQDGRPDYFAIDARPVLCKLGFGDLGESDV